MELEHLVSDPRFADLSTRRAHAAALVVELDRAFAQRDSKDWLSRFEGGGNTVGIVARTTDVVEDPQAYACGALVQADGIGGAGFTVDSPFRISDESKRRPSQAPNLGQHSEEVLREHGFDCAEIDVLRRAGAIA